jgi:predicted amidohydrolase YtcJ
MRALSGLILAGLGATTWGWSAVAATTETPPDIILFNGKIFTSDADHPYVQAVAIRDARIVAIGDSDTVKALGAAVTRQIDVGGRTVIPGINDAHNHIEINPLNLVEVNFQAERPTTGDLRKELPQAAAEAPKGALLEATISPAIFHDTTVNLEFRSH